MTFYFRVEAADDKSLPLVRFVRGVAPLEETARRAVIAQVLRKGGRVKHITALTREAYEQGKKGA